MLFSTLDFVSKSTSEDTDDAEETDDILNPAEKLKTAVHSFLRKSASLVCRKIFRNIFERKLPYLRNDQERLFGRQLDL